MGMSENQAKHSLYNTGGSDVEAASMYFFENIKIEFSYLMLMLSTA